MVRLYFATDIHGSNRCWKKFINAKEFYKANVLILGGDMTGKAVMPIVAQPNRTFWVDFLDNRVNLKNLEELSQMEQVISDRGYYPIRVEEKEYNEIRADPKKLTEWTNEAFRRLTIERVNEWMDYAEAKLRNASNCCYVCPGNDDSFEIDSAIEKSKAVSSVEGKIVKINSHYELLGTGWSTPTPWNTFRECSEEELLKKIEKMASQLADPSKSVFDVHDPPISSGLDEGPDLDEELRPKRGGRSSKAVGSIAVRQAIEKYQPLLGLHGHIHESKGVAKIGRTLCINPGSVYEEGTLNGALIDIEDAKIKRYSTTAG
jgi:Icc-related predicted phosphoesterase